MNVLSALLPGFREFRTPIAAGALWCISFVIAANLLPAPLLAKLEEIRRDVAGAIDWIPDPVLGSSVLVAIYLVGVLATQLTDTTGKVIRGIATQEFGEAVGWAVAVIVFVVIPISISGGWGAVVAAALLAWPVLVAYFDWKRPKVKGSFPRYLAEFWRETFVGMPQFLFELSRAFTYAWNPARRQVDYFYREDILRGADASTSLQKDLVDAVPDKDLTVILRNINATFINPNRSDIIPNTVQDWTSLETFMGGKRESSETTQFLRTRLTDLIKNNREARATFLRDYARRSAHREDVERRVEAAEVKLRMDHPQLHDEIDRLRAESAFRRSVALPLAVAIVSSWLLVSERLTTFLVVQWLSYVIGVAIFASFRAAGRSKENEALRLLYLALEQTGVKVRSEQILRRNDFQVGRKTWSSYFNWT